MAPKQADNYHELPAGVNELLVPKLQGMKYHLPEEKPDMIPESFQILVYHLEPAGGPRTGFICTTTQDHRYYPGPPRVLMSYEDAICTPPKGSGKGKGYADFNETKHLQFIPTSGATPNNWRFNCYSPTCMRHRAHSITPTKTGGVTSVASQTHTSCNATQLRSARNIV